MRIQWLTASTAQNENDQRETHMLKRIVKEAAASGSGGESSRKQKRKESPRRRNAGSSSESEEEDASPTAMRNRSKSAERKKQQRGGHASDDSDDDRKQAGATSSSDTPRHAASTSRFTKNLQNKLKRMWNAGKMKRTPLLDLATIEAVYSAMHGKDKKRARTKLLGMFAHYDTDETGRVDDARFAKCIAKVGIHLKRSADYDVLAHCFPSHAKGPREDDESATSSGAKRKKPQMVDYVAFVNFACNVRDSEKLSEIARKLRRIISRYDDKHSQSTSEPYNVFADLKKLDKQKLKWIPSEQFSAFMEEHERPVFKLSTKEVQTLMERFEYEYENEELGVDYEQFAQWLQPMLHLDMKELHRRVQDLVEKANERGGWDLAEMFRAMDEDGDGQVSGLELKEALLEMGLPLTDTQIRCLVDEYDTNGDGRVQYDEFISLFPSMKKKKSTTHGTRRKENENDSDEESGTDRGSTRSRPHQKKKNTRKNTFSWEIGKAFARKQSVKGGSSKAGSERIDVPKKTLHSSSDDSSEESPRNAKQKSKKKKAPRLSDEDSESDQRKTPRKNTSKKKRSSSDPDASESEKRTSTSKSNLRSKKSARPEPSSTETDEESRRITRDSKRMKRKPSRSHAATSDDDGAQESTSSEPSSTLRPSRSQQRKGVSAARRRSERQVSAASARSHRSSGKPSRSRSKTRPRQRIASTASAKPQSSPRNRSRSRLKSKHNLATRAKRRFTSNGAQDGSTSSAGSDGHNSSQSSGLDMEQLRQLKKGSKTYPRNEGSQGFDDGGEVEGEDQTRSRSDGEYEKHLKRSLRRAFDFFDLDQSDAIEKKELSHVLRALGHEFTTEELDAEMARADLDQNGQLDFHEFVAFVKRQLRQKQFLLSKQREMEIRQAFQSLDNDHNGVLDEKEFEYLIYKVLGVELSVEEQDALLDFVDENGDGNINEDEFIAFMKVMEEFHKTQGGKTKRTHFLASLDGTSKLALTAMKKLVRGAPIDLDKNLLMFFGVPTNFRPAISSAATCRALQVNTLERALSFPSPQMIVALAQDPNQNVGGRKDGAMFASAAKKADGGSDEYLLLQQVESWQSHAIISLKRAAGVPKPFDTREEDVLKRCVHVCLFQEQEEMHTMVVKRKGKKRDKPAVGGGSVVGNVHEIPVHWHPGEEDVWEFSKKATKEDKYKFLVRTNTVNDHLYLLVEFIIHLRMAKRGESRKMRRKHKPREGGSDDESVRSEAREMVCCWCKIPIRTLLARRVDVVRSQQKLWGGTAHAPIDIEQDEILRRRTGWRALANAFKKPSPPAMGVKSVPIDSFPEELQKCVLKMPPTIIAPFLSLPILAEYMTLMKSMLSSIASASAGGEVFLQSSLTCRRLPTYTCLLLLR